MGYRVARSRTGAAGMLAGMGPVNVRILLVDDDPNLLVFLGEQLRDDGYTVTTARDGLEAQRRLEAGWPHPLIVDMMMPRMDGPTPARQGKARADPPDHVPSPVH